MDTVIKIAVCITEDFEGQISAESGGCVLNYMVWMVLAVPVIVTGMILHFKLKEWGRQKWNILPKCLSTWMVVCTGIMGIWTAGDRQGMHKTWILAALVLFLLADGFLEVQFFLGMGVFAAGHLILIVWFLEKGNYSGLSFVLWIVFLGLALLLFRRELEQGKQNPKLYIMILYLAVLMGMAAIAVMLPWQLDSTYSWAAAGAVLFSVSDMMVGKSFFHKLSKPADYLALSLYYTGIFCFSMMTWM